MRRSFLSLVVAGTVLGAPAGATAAWSVSPELGPVSAGVSLSGLSVGPFGTTLLAWTAYSPPPGRVVLPSPETNDHRQGRTGLVGSDGRARTVARFGRTVVAGPVTSSDGSALVLSTRQLAGYGGMVRLSLDRLGADGSVRGSRVLAGRTLITDAALAANRRGRVVAAWGQVRFAGQEGELIRYALRAAFVSLSPSGAVVARPETLERFEASDFYSVAAVATAVGPDGRAVVAFASSDASVGRPVGDGPPSRRRFPRSVDLFFGRPGHGFGRRVAAGPHCGPPRSRWPRAGVGIDGGRACAERGGSDSHRGAAAARRRGR